MRESNFAFPAQNRACVCISSQLYDRRALDTTSPLPLFNSLTHLTYLTSTSPRIREILTMDGGLERLVRLLREFCAHPPPPESPAQFYGLLPPLPAKLPHAPTHAPDDSKKRPFDRAAAYRFSLAFQSVVNIGVRGSEPIRARVVQAGALDVVGCVLEAWLASKGFAVAPSVSATGMPRETREQRHARRQALADLRQREMHAIQAHQLARQLQRHVQQIDDEDEDMLDLSIDVNPAPTDHQHTPATASNDTSPTSTPRGSGTPTTTEPERDSTTDLVFRQDQDGPARRRSTIRPAPSPAAVAAASRTDTEPESDADAEMEDASTASAAPAPPSGPAPAAPMQQGRRAVGIVGENDDAPTLDVDMNLDILLAGATDDFVALDPATNDTLTPLAAHPGNRDDRPQREEDRTPRARVARLPDPHPVPVPPAPPAPGPSLAPPASHAHDSGPYREEDVLLSLQLLAYLSKYPHVRQAFYKPRAVFNPALQGVQTSAPTPATKESTSGTNFFKALAGAAVGRNKDTKDKHRALAPTLSADSSPSSRPRPLTQSTNVFSLVERFTFRPSPSETQLPVPPPLLPPEIQYWAGVIMRNACRKDESRGGIRQCANMLCGKWESYPREFAKCRRCRKAKYCGKECQSRAWAEGHRFWCSAREEEGDPGEPATGAGAGEGTGAGADVAEAGVVGAVRPRGDRTRVGAVPDNAHAHIRAGPSRATQAQAQPSTATAVAAAATAAETTTATSRLNADLYRATLAPPPGATITYTRNHAAAFLAPPHPPVPYLHMAPSHNHTARRRAGTMPGPSTSPADLPGSLGTGAETRPRRGAGPGAGPDDMVLG